MVLRRIANIYNLEAEEGREWGSDFPGEAPSFTVTRHYYEQHLHL